MLDLDYEMKILDDIREILSASHPSVNISMGTYLEYSDGSHLDMSSLEIIEFIVALETKYDIIIDFEDRYYTIGDVVSAVAAYLENKER